MASVIEQLIGRWSPSSVVMIDVNCRPLLIDDRDAYVRRVRSMLASAAVVKVSTDDLAYLAPDTDAVDAARELLDAGAMAVLLTDGSGDVRVLTATEERSVPVPQVDVVDTIGAGDTFGGAALAWWAANGCTRQRPGIDGFADPGRRVRRQGSRHRVPTGRRRPAVGPRVVDRSVGRSCRSGVDRAGADASTDSRPWG